MTVETKLRSAMAAAVAPTASDADQLVALARRRGLAIRRRRQALAAVGVAATVGAIALAPSLVAGDHGTQGRTSVMVGTTTTSLDTSSTAPFSGRSTAAALLYAVGLEARGSATGFHGSATDRDMAESYAFFTFTPQGSSTAGQVAINVQTDWAQGPAKNGDQPRTEVGRCQSFMTQCTSTRLADGSTLTTYDDDSTHGSRGIRRVASLYRPADDTRIVVSASNGFDVTELDEQVNGDEPVLGTGQLVAVATQPWWGRRLPAYFTAQGDRLDDFTGIDDLAATASASPTPAGD
jgi:hypothetical protein